MKAWENIMNAAMLGTDKPMPGSPDTTDELAEVFERIEDNSTTDRETKFLQKAALIYNYRQCGFVPLQKQDLPVNKADEEILPYCSANAVKVLNSILNEDNLPLLQLWLTQCSNNSLLAPPELLHVLFDKAQKEITLQPLLKVCGGNRGIWLSNLNLLWNYLTPLPDDELWQTGKPEERMKVLQKIRQQNPDKAREWLMQTWSQENAASKLELLKTFRVNITQADLPWLDSLLTEKGQRVKDEVITLIKLIPGSSIISKYEALLSESVVLKKDKALLGMMTKVSIRIKLPDIIDESIFASGIEKLAGQKSTMSDENFIIYQLIALVPPMFWEKQFNVAPEQVIELFEKHAATMVPALGLAISRFRAKSWIPLFIHQKAFYLDFLPMMDSSEKERYLLQFIAQDPHNIIHTSLKSNEEWSVQFANAALGYMASYPYEYNRGFYNKHIGLIPVNILPQLERYNAKDSNMQSSWEKVRHHLSKLLSLKQQTLQAFNA